MTTSKKSATPRNVRVSVGPEVAKSLPGVPTLGAALMRVTHDLNNLLTAFRCWHDLQNFSVAPAGTQLTSAAGLPSAHEILDRACEQTRLLSKLAACCQDVSLDIESSES